ncbi:MAG: hypothetical protein AB7F76_17655 [Parvibaculaceae bacterium]
MVRPPKTPIFVQLNIDWNADPNVPFPEVFVKDSEVRLWFLLNHFAYEAEKGEAGILVFNGCSAWRLGSENDEGWYLGQCRYSRLAPAWGQFYELRGDDDLRDLPDDWQVPHPRGNGQRHFLFYMRDDMFECLALDWRLERVAASSQ